MKQYILPFLLILAASSKAQVIDISEAREQGTGATVTVEGVVTSGSELGNIIRYFQDETGGLAAYDSKVSSLEKGDRVQISGTLKEYAELLEIDPVSSLTVLSKDNPLPDPVVLTPNQLGENYEGQIVEIKNAEFAAAGGSFAAGTNYDFTADGQQGAIRIHNSNSPFVGTLIPSGKVTIRGILSQYYETYQILVRELEDIQSSKNINFTSLVELSNLSQTGFTLSWETDSSGSSEAFYGNSPALELGVLSGTAGTSHNVNITWADPSELFYVRPFSVRGQDTAFTRTGVYITQSASSGKMLAYFNRPVDHSVSTGTDAVYLDETIDDTLIAYINRAEGSIDFTIYNFNNNGIENISDALNDAYNRGLDVRVIYDGNTDATGVNTLHPDIGKIASPESNYPFYGIMHNKFVVFDAQHNDPEKAMVWTGATNFTAGQINTDPNNVIIIHDQSLAKTYQLEFNEMYGSPGEEPDPQKAKFGPDKEDNTPHEFIIGESKVYCYFSPSDGVNNRIIDLINESDEEIRIATMLITRTAIGYAIRDAAGRSVDTRVLLKDEGDQYVQNVIDIMSPVLQENLKISGESGIMHHKYMIIDPNFPQSDPILLTGSHNWSSSAEDRNDENTLIIHDSVMANVYLQEFTERFKNGIVVVAMPETANDYETILEGQNLVYDILQNDELPGDVHVEIIQEPDSGTASLTGNNEVDYTPNAKFTGLDTIGYRVCMVSNANLCDSAILVVLVQQGTGFEDLTKDNDFLVYPNPGREQFNLVFPERFVKPVEISILDLNGRIVHRENFEPLTRTLTIEHHLDPGVYLLRLRSGTTGSQKKLLIH